MSDLIDQLNDQMDEATRLLMQMDYLQCEQVCLDALQLARNAHAWNYYARILLPLQEVRRQRRMIAAEGRVWIGTNTFGGSLVEAVTALRSGCMAITHPIAAAEARDAMKAAREARRHVELLWIDSPLEADVWVLRSFSLQRPEVHCTVTAAPASWCNRWWAPGQPAPKEKQTAAAQPADWILNASESLGDAALASVPLHEEAEVKTLTNLESCLDIVPDHEILHQTLGRIARELGKNPPSVD